MAVCGRRVLSATEWQRGREFYQPALNWRSSFRFPSFLERSCSFGPVIVKRSCSSLRSLTTFEAGVRQAFARSLVPTGKSWFRPWMTSGGSAQRFTALCANLNGCADHWQSGWMLSRRSATAFPQGNVGAQFRQQFEFKTEVI